MNDPQRAFASRLAEIRRQELLAQAESRRQVAQLRKNEPVAPDGHVALPAVNRPVRPWPFRTALLAFFVRFRHGG